MSEIQLGSGPSSSATHHITQTSRTLNRRYVTRPSNLAIEEAARSAKPTTAQPVTSTPSRLVNLRVHSADLIRANEQPSEPSAESSVAIVPVIPHVVELGSNASTNEAPASAPLDLTQVIPPEEVVESIPTEFPPETTEISTISTQTYYDDGTVTSTSIVATPVSDTDTEALAMSIAADYAAASLGSSSPTMINEPSTVPSADSIDAVARVASEAIATIRTATDPKEVAEQITSLKAFAEDIKSASSAPEMLELSNTIETFINVAMKSDKIQEEVQKKLAQDEAAKNQVKVTTSKPSTTTSKVTAKKPLATSKPVAKPAVKRTATRPSTRTAVRPSAKRVTKVARPQLVVDQDQALRKALRSVAAMDDEPTSQSKAAKKPQIKKKTSSKRFVLAFFCAVICVSAIIYFVGTNIPDISVKVAAMQTGIEATYPSYVPRDFSLSDISSENGKITLTFKGPDRASFTLTEEKSSWDSTTLLHNYVEPTWQSNYVTTHEQGITLYISGANAAWVNGGVLYKIDAPSNSLTKKQLRNIVISM